MRTFFGHAAAALVLVASAQPAGAQTVFDSETIVARQPLQLTQAQRTTIYRTIVPQGRGRAPIIRERIVTEPVILPMARERVIARPAETYAYDAYAYAPAPAYRERVVRPAQDVDQSYALAVGTRVPRGAQLAPLPSSVVAEVPAVQPYRFMMVNNRMLLVDPATSIVVADLTDY